MKKVNFLKIGVVALFLGALSFSCSKKEGEPQPANNNSVPDRATVIKTLKNLRFSFTEPGSGNYNYNSSTNTLTYSDPNTGYRYSEVKSGYSYSGVEPQISGNLSKGGGSFEVDGKTITLDYVFCLTADDGGLFGADVKVGSSMLVGISGKFDPNNEENSKLDYLVVAYVNEEKANGKYDVIFQGLEDETNSDKFAFFYVLDLTKVDSMEDFEDNEDAKFYFSTKGSMTFSNGNIALNNIKMAELISLSSEDEELGKEIDAAGELSCE